MADSHLTRELLRAVARGDVDPRVLSEIERSHLMSLCDHCREEIEAFRKEQTGDASEGYSRAFEVLPAQRRRCIRSSIPRTSTGKPWPRSCSSRMRPVARS